MSTTDYEKGGDHGITHDASSTEASPVYKNSQEAYQGVSFWTRMGCTPESFKRRTLEDKHNQLSQILKKRHLHMIAVSEQPLTGFHPRQDTNSNFRSEVQSVLVSSLVLVPLLALAVQLVFSSPSASSVS